MHTLSITQVLCRRPLPDQPLIHPAIDVPENSRAIRAGVDIIRKPSIQLNLVDAVPCKIALERDKEHHFHLLSNLSGKLWVGCSCRGVTFKTALWGGSCCCTFGLM